MHRMAEEREGRKEPGEKRERGPGRERGKTVFPVKKKKNVYIIYIIYKYTYM